MSLTQRKAGEGARGSESSEDQGESCCRRTSAAHDLTSTDYISEVSRAVWYLVLL